MNSSDVTSSGDALGSAPSAWYYRHLFEHAGFAMISVDNELSVRTWNNAAAELFGASAGSMVGAPIVSVMPSERRDQGARLIRQTIDEGTINSAEFQHRDAQGRRRTLAVTLSPITDDAGNRIGALASFRDITRRIDLETELAERDKMVSLGRMAGALAHHFNNILAGAVTSVDFALATDDANLQSRALRQTSEALARSTKLIESLGAFAEGDRRHHDKSDLIELIHSVEKYMKPEMAVQNVTLKLDLKPIPPMPVPRAQLVTVIENILHNALDAMPHGGTATLSTSVEGGVVQMSITDTGCGMEHSELQKVFEPFYSSKTSEVMDFEHHPGMGLTVVHGILQVLGHSVSIKSKPGESTTVSVRFDRQCGESGQ
ncbi:MAG: PAS domain S-box protein [Phycisphaerae bacterium]